MTRPCQITVDGTSFLARRGELLLDAALNNGIDLPHDCRAGHCGTCCVRLISGEVHGGKGTEPDVVHACQCRITGDAVIATRTPSSTRAVEGVVSSLLPLSPEVIEVGVTLQRALPYHAGQYVQVQFEGYPSRPFSTSHPLRGSPNEHAITVWFHVRRMQDGVVTSALGRRIKPGHRVTLSGPFGTAHFRRNMDCRLILVGTNTGFAPIWSIAVSALHENPERSMVVIAGGRTIQALYMGPALARLSRFPNVHVVPVCSDRRTVPKQVKPGRPTEYLPPLLWNDLVYACGAPGMVESVEAIAARAGAVCYADPFMTTIEARSTRPSGRQGSRAAPTVSRLALERRQPSLMHAQWPPGSG